MPCAVQDKDTVFGHQWSLFSPSPGMSGLRPTILWPALTNRPFVVSSDQQVWMESRYSRGGVSPRLSRQFLKARTRLGFLNSSCWIAVPSHGNLIVHLRAPVPPPPIITLRSLVPLPNWYRSKQDPPNLPIPYDIILFALV